MASPGEDGSVSRSNSSWSQTIWGNSVTRSYTARRLRPVLQRVGTKQWERDADLGVDGVGHREASRWTTLLLAYQCIGVVFGDLGTSPLYTFAGIFADPSLKPTPENFVGAVSLIIWTLISLALIKYATIVLRADDKGQGGSMALYSQLRRQGLLSRHAEQRRKSGGGGGAHSNASGRHQLSEANTEGMVVVPQDWRQRLIGANATQTTLRVMVVVGVGLILGDGVLTPAVTIVSAMEGLQIGIPSISRSAIVGVSCAIIATLFLVQRFGAAKLGFAFSPVIVTYLLFNSAVGIYNIVYWSNGTILKAFSPHYWFLFFTRNGHTGWRVLSGVLLCSTGTEALFADLGHFSRPAIQLSFMLVVFPSLCCMYLGQAAYLEKNPAGVSTAFFASLPGGKGLFWAMLVVITAASIVASQALISASYQIVAQAIAQGFFPKFHVTHTSRKHSGQIFIAVVNYTLMTLTLIITIAFRTSAKLSEAYGLAVICDMFLTTCFMTLILWTVWRKNPIYAPIFFLVFGLIEWCFLSSSLLKVPRGAWFTLMMAGLYALFMSNWFWGAGKKAAYFKSTQQSLGQFLKGRSPPAASGHTAPPAALGSPGRMLSHAASSPLPDVQEAQPLLTESTAVQTQLPGVALFYSNALHGVPHVLTELSRMYPSLPQVSIFLTNRSVPLPEVLPAERLLVQQLGARGWYHVVVRYGYAEQIKQGEEFVQGMMRHIQSLLYRSLCHRLVESVTFAPLAHRKKLSRAAAALVNATNGDMYGDGHHSPELTKHTVSSAHISLSTHLTHQSTRRGASRRPTILDEYGEVRWPAAADSTAAAAAEAGELPAGASGTQSSPNGDAGRDADAAAAVLNARGSGSIGRVSRKAAEAAAKAAAVQAASFEDEMEELAKDIRGDLAANGNSGIPEKASPQVDLLQRLAAELALVAEATKAGTLGYVIGRSHAKLGEVPGWKSVPRRYLLELPFTAIVKNTEQDMDVAYGVPQDKLLEVGLAYRL